MARRGNNCRCCDCVTHTIVEVPLVRQAGHYSQQAINGKGPFRLDMGGLWLTISEVVAGALRATTDGNPLKLTGVHPVGISVPTAWHPVTVAVNGTLANSGRFAAGSQPAHTEGSVSIAIPKGPVAWLEAYLDLFTLPAECAVPYYGNVPLNLVYRFDVSSSPTADEYPYPINVFGILPFAAPGSLAETNNTTGSYKQFVNLDKLQPIPQFGIENFWVPREGVGVFNVIPVGDKASAPPLARYSSFFALRIGSQSRWIVGEESNPATSLFNGYSLSVVTQADGGDERSAVAPLVTAHAFRGGSAYATFGPGDLSVQYAPGRSALAVPGFTNAAPVSVGGQWVTVFRNGQSVLKEVRPTAQQLGLEMSKEGVYLVVSDVTEATDPPGWAETNQSRPYVSQFLRQYASLVVDTTPPLVGFVPLDDAYIDNFFDDLSPSPVRFPRLIGLFSSEPINVAPTRERFGLNTKEPVTLPLAPGNYTLAAYFSDEVADRAGNAPESSGLQPVKLLEVPASPMRRGARGAITLPREDCVQTEPQIFYGNLYHSSGKPQWLTRETGISYIDLEFPLRAGERHYRIVADANAIKPSQFVLLRNGQAVTGAITVERITDRVFRAYLPAGSQPNNSVMFITWTPDADTLSECILRQSFPSRNDFPPLSQANDTVVYAAEDTGEVFEKGDDDYVPYLPEPCVCAARASWIVLPETPPLELIDTSSTVSLIGRHVSVSEAAGGLTIGEGTTEVQSSDGMYLPVAQASGEAALSPDQRVTGIGQFSDVVAEGFVPQVPAPLPAQSPARCSYFGLTTTIDPCPPAFVSPCAGPAVAQKHASVIRSTQDIQQLEVQLVNIEGGIEKLDRPLWGPFDPALNSRFDNGSFTTNRIVADIMVMSKTPYVFSALSHGKLSSQNTWFCTEGGRDADDGVMMSPAYSRPTYVNGALLLESSSRENKLAESQHEIRFGFPAQYWAFAENVRFGDLWDDVPIPVQYWKNGQNGLPVNSPEPIVRKMKGKLWQGGMQASASAYRLARTYHKMGTATLSELAVTLSWRMTVASAVTFTDRRYPLPTYLEIGDLEEVPPGDQGQGWAAFGAGFGFYKNNPAEDLTGDTIGTFVRALDVPKPVLFEAMPSVAEKKDILRRGWLTLSHTVIFSDEKEQAFAAGQTVMLPGPVLGGGRDYRWKIRKV